MRWGSFIAGLLILFVFLPIFALSGAFIGISTGGVAGGIIGLILPAIIGLVLLFNGCRTSSKTKLEKKLIKKQIEEKEVDITNKNKNDNSLVEEIQKLREEISTLKKRQINKN